MSLLSSSHWNQQIERKVNIRTAYSVCWCTCNLWIHFHSKCFLHLCWINSQSSIENDNSFTLSCGFCGDGRKNIFYSCYNIIVSFQNLYWMNSFSKLLLFIALSSISCSRFFFSKVEFNLFLFPLNFLPSVHFCNVCLMMILGIPFYTQELSSIAVKNLNFDDCSPCKSAHLILNGF